jgi:hypothetical protein
LLWNVKRILRIKNINPNAILSCARRRLLTP